MKALKIVLIVVFLSVLGFIVFRSLNRSHSFDFQTTNLQKRDINETIFIAGNVFPAREIEIKAQLSGILEDIFVEIGEYVQSGSPIASIQLVPSASDIMRLEFNVNVAQIDYDARSREHSTDKRLFEADVISRSEMDASTRAYLLARENLISAKNQLDILKKGRIASRNISNIVTTTTSGTVIDIPLEIGSSVIERSNFSPGTTIAIVAETDRFRFRTFVAEHFLRHINIGDTVYLTFSAYEDLTAKASITQISSRGNLESGIMRYMVDAMFAVTDDMPVLRSGYSATAEIILNRRQNANSIEEKHLIFRNNSTYLYVLENLQREPIRRVVVTGISDGVYTEILDGVTLEDKIVINYRNSIFR